MTDIEAIVRRCYRELLGTARWDDTIDMGRRRFEDDGMSSLQLVTFVTTVCDESGLPLTALTEQDIARMKTPGDVIAIIQTAFQKASTP
jgi:acyl carrier protein